MEERQQRRIGGLPLAFWIVTAVAFVNAVSFTAIIPVLYPYAKKFGLTDFEASLLTTTFAASQFLGTPFLGGFSDRIGRKPVLIVSLAGTVLANIASGLAPAAWVLFLARAFDGLTGGNTSVARAVVSDVTAPAERTRAFGIFGATFRLGFVAGPPLSFLAQKVPPIPGFDSLGMSFLVAASIALVAVVLSVFVLPESRRRQAATGGPIVTKDDLPFVAVGRAVREPRYRRVFLLSFLSGFTFTIFTFAFQPFFLNVLEQPAERLALVFAAIGVVGFTAQVFALDALQKRLSRVRLLAGALAMRAVVFFLLPALPFLWAFGALMAVFGFVNSFPLPLVNAILSLRTSDQEQGKVLGINSACLSLANAVGPAVSGLLVMVDYGTPFYVTGVGTMLIAGLALTIERPAENA